MEIARQSILPNMATRGRNSNGCAEGAGGPIRPALPYSSLERDFCYLRTETGIRRLPRARMAEKTAFDCIRHHPVFRNLDIETRKHEG
jgi:hypothetical protein